MQGAIFSAGAAVLLLGTVFLNFPQGLAAWANTLPEFLSGWVLPSGAPASTLAGALLVYEPLALLFGLAGIIRGFIQFRRYSVSEPVELEDSLVSRDFHQARLMLGLAAWAIIAFIVLMLYPARQTAELVWVIIPLWVLAAVELSRHLPEGENSLISLGQAALIFILLALFWLNLASVARVAPASQGYTLRLLVLFGILLLALVTTILISLGWSWAEGRRGLVWGLLAALGAYSIAALWGATQLRPGEPQELWSPAPAAGQADLLLQTVQDLSRLHSSDQLEIVSTAGSNALRWLFRGYPNARYVSQLNPSEQPALVITPRESEIPSLTAGYRGQDFVWFVRPGWGGSLPADFARWIVFREAPLIKEYLVVWVRTDLFPGNSD
jgi:hypothetical protein